LRYVPATRLDQPVIDTMGAGDATLASFIVFLLTEGTPWRRCLQRAMDVAGATCRSTGAALVAWPN
jgi:fructokinase